MMIFRSVAMAGALAILTVSAVHADLKVVQTTQIDNPQLDAYMETMTPEQRAAMAHTSNPLLRVGPQQTVVYVRGPQTRADMGGNTYLVNAATHKTEVLYRASRTYTTRPYQAPPSGAASPVQATVKDSGQTKMIAGHLARRYFITATMASQPGTIIRGEIWAALDLPRPAQSATGMGPFTMIQSVFKNVKGYPLRTSLAVTGSPMGDTTIVSNVVSISKSPLPASVFAIPAGYKKSAAGM